MAVREALAASSRRIWRIRFVTRMALPNRETAFQFC